MSEQNPSAEREADAAGELLVYPPLTLFEGEVVRSLNAIESVLCQLLIERWIAGGMTPTDALARIRREHHTAPFEPPDH